MDVLRLDNVSASPWGAALLRDVSFSLASETITAIIGPNGAGKSSLLHVMAGGSKVTAGDVNFLNKPLLQWPASERSRHIGFLPQSSRLSFPFTVEEVILLGRTPHECGRRCDRAIVQEVMAATDTDVLAQRPYTQLSGGEQQRVQLARCLAQIWREEDAKGRLLLLDEPGSAMDVAHQSKLKKLLKMMAQRGCAVAFVMHDFNMANAVADKVLVLRDGNVVAWGGVNEVITETMFLDVFDVSVYIRHEMGYPQVVVK